MRSAEREHALQNANNDIVPVQSAIAPYKPRIIITLIPVRRAMQFSYKNIQIRKVIIDFHKHYGKLSSKVILGLYFLQLLEFVCIIIFLMKELIKLADETMYRVKNTSKNGFAFANESIK